MVIFSGIQPTGRKHLGNYIGAITQYVAGQDRGDPAIYCIVDLHATTVDYEPARLREYVYDTVAILLAAGLEPDRCILFRQGDLHEHAELCWLLASVTAVGEDQREHLELMRNVAERFNARYGDVLVVPEHRIPEVGARVRDLQEPARKMSTTGGTEQGTVLVLDEPGVVERKFKRAVTDSGTEIVRSPDKPGITNLIEILAAVRAVEPEAVEAEFTGSGYGALKGAVGTEVAAWLAPVRERYDELRPDEEALEDALEAGAEKARAIASATVADVRAAMGVGPVRRPSLR